MTDYTKLKVAELKELVKERGIVAGGLKLKQQFIDALQTADAEKDSGESRGQAQNDAEDETANATEKVENPEAAQESQTAASVAEAEVAAPDNSNGMEVDQAKDTSFEESAKAEVKPDADEPMGDAQEVDHKQDQDKEQEADAESNKRKRRSPTPTLPEESISKKLKTSQDGPALPEDARDAMDIEKAEGVEDASAKGRASSPQGDTFVSDVTSTTPSQHFATRALYIRNLVRPLQPNVLREHLLTIASPPNSDVDASVVEEFHLDKLRSHALVLFSSIAAASRARSALHDQVWPPEPMRKPLFADFIPEDRFQEWVDLEISRERDNLRWEVVYTPSTTEDGSHTVTASLQEVAATRQPTQNHTRSDGPPPTGPRASLAGEGMPNAPSGPRTTQTPQPQNIPEPTQSKSFTTLDASYKFSETKPKLYWQPVDPELAAKRLEELERETSQAWDGNMGTGEMRRYTFEDGDKVVDGGVDWGKFGGGGHHAGPPPRRGGRDFGGRGRRGGGYRGGGGYGGGGGGYRGDSYRGGGARW